MRSTTHASGIALLLAALSGAGPAAAQEAVARPVDLGTLGGPSSEAAAINEAGAIVGEARNGNPAERIRAVRATYHGFFKRPDGPLVDIDGEPGIHSSPIALNRDGVVLAELYGSSAQRYAVVFWREGAGQQRVPAPDGYTRVHAADIDDQGNVLGTADGDYGRQRAFLYDIARGTHTVLPCPDGASCSAIALNEAGTVLGQVDGAPALWEAGTAAIALLPQDARLTEYYPGDLNERGDVIGYAHGADQWPEVLLWSADADHALRVIGDGRAYALNDRGIAVGDVPIDRASPWGDRRPHAWALQTGRAIPLPGFEGGPALGGAADVNDAGTIAGTLWREEGSRAVSWQLMLAE